MRFEKFLLDDYLQTKEGQKVFAFFTNFKKNYLNTPKVFEKFVNSFLDLQEAAEELLLSSEELLLSSVDDELLEPPKKIKDIDDFIEKYFSKEGFEEDPRGFQACIPLFSCLYYIEQPEYAFPYLFYIHFYRFLEICEIFEITIPPIPGKTRHLERIHYYFDLCRVMYEFRKEHNLTPVELCVFLYGFAPRFFTKYIENELPEPNNIHIVGASREDVEAYTEDPPTQDSVYVWQGNEEMLPGDIIIMYERSPYSRIASIWRAISPGYDDPFHFYPGKIFVSHPIQVPHIEFKTLFSDPVWGKNALVKAHMEGIGFKRTVITREEYERLKVLFKKQNQSFDLHNLPEPPPYAQFYHDDIVLEKDVEEKLLEPLLSKLGYNVKKEFTRQFPIRMGRGVRYYPDYALHATGMRGEEHADFIWEAKYRIPTKKQLSEDYGQARSYAVRLQTAGFGLVSLEGIKIWTASNHFDFEKMLSYSW